MEVCWLDAGLPPSSREEELFGLGALLPGAVEGSCGLASTRVVDCVGGGADNFVSLDGYSYFLQRKGACDELIPTNCLPEGLLDQLIHVNVEFLLEGEESVWDVLVLVPWDVFECHGDWEGTYKILNDSNEVRVSLPLLQLLVRVAPMCDDALAVSPCPQLWHFVGGVDLISDGWSCKNFSNYC